MLKSIKYNFAHLLDFRGRDGREVFWYYFLFVFLLNMAVGLVMVIPLMGEIMAGAMVAARNTDPAAVNAAMATRMDEMLEPMFWFGVAIGLINVVLLAGAMTRRCHDSSLSGRWGLLPLGLQVAATWYGLMRTEQSRALMAQLLSGASDYEAAMRAQSELSAQSLLGWLPLLAIVALGIRKSTPGPNRFGEPPFRF